MGRGRPKGIFKPIRYFSEEERKQAITQSKTKYMVNKEWRCPVCDNHNYTLAGKWNHQSQIYKHILCKRILYKSIQLCCLLL